MDKAQRCETPPTVETCGRKLPRRDVSHPMPSDTTATHATTTFPIRSPVLCIFDAQQARRFPACTTVAPSVNQASSSARQHFSSVLDTASHTWMVTVTRDFDSEGATLEAAITALTVSLREDAEDGAERLRHAPNHAASRRRTLPPWGSRPGNQRNDRGRHRGTSPPDPERAG